jgi:hypothetical protein
MRSRRLVLGGIVTDEKCCSEKSKIVFKRRVVGRGLDLLIGVGVENKWVLRS